MADFVTPDELHHREHAAPTVIDVRGLDEYRAGHLPGAIDIPADQLRDRLADIPTNRPVVTY